MCWSAINKSDLNRHIAKDNIPVTKFVAVFGNDDIFSYYNDFAYKIGEVYNTKLGKPHLSDTYWGEMNVINHGFHSYSVKVKIRKRDSQLLNAILNSRYADGFLKTFKHPNRGIGNMAVADCIIPKGSAYYLNSYGEYVSDSIKIINVYKIE